jgi:hypothetical protein
LYPPTAWENQVVKIVVPQCRRTEIISQKYFKKICAALKVMKKRKKNNEK